MSTFTNISAYQFVPLDDLKPLRQRLLNQCLEWGIRGTILLSPEGINLFVAGRDREIHSLIAELRHLPGLAGLEPKISLSDEQPFARMLVKIKKEIIAFGIAGIDPARRPSPKLSATELKQWLDEGRPVTLLDTRNNYEVKLGTFANAIPIGVDHFREFPEAVSRLPAEMKTHPIVMFCTGGIRCEKAGPFMEREGFEQIYQLDGGILKYFEECGNAHYQGECFVFDQRVGLDQTLRETKSTQCFACQTPLTAEDMADPRFKLGQSCTYCFKSTEERMAETIAERHAAIVTATTPLPGSQVYDNHRPVRVSAPFAGNSLLDFLCKIFDHIPVEEWKQRFEQRRILDNDRQPAAATRIVQAGERYWQLQPAIREPDVNPAIRILHEDEALIILHKPAPLPMHPAGRFNRNTLQSILTEVYRGQTPRQAHRLDASTSGLVALTRRKCFAANVQQQFERGEIEKVYLARVIGHPPEDRFECDLAISATSGDCGSREIDAIDGLSALTLFRVLNRFADGTALLEVQPKTGRTNQIRVHLWHLGWPILGDQLYLPGRQLGATQTHAFEDPPLCLLAWKLTLNHPVTKVRMTFETDLPKWVSED
ncbi:MAG: pseudouridine synthase [Planctomycetes bacterium]|nr:pseudouridine synthase [Planctomycetota bacterium]